MRISSYNARGKFGKQERRGFKGEKKKAVNSIASHRNQLIECTFPYLNSERVQTCSCHVQIWMQADAKQRG